MQPTLDLLGQARESRSRQHSQPIRNMTGRQTMTQAQGGVSRLRSDGRQYSFRSPTSPLHCEDLRTLPYFATVLLHQRRLI